MSVREKLEQRLTELRAEYDSGQRALAELEQKQATLRDTVLRISGAIQVLEEELGTRDRQLPPD
jgi:predicted nuclease with TOPRIM domain